MKSEELCTTNSFIQTLKMFLFIFIFMQVIIFCLNYKTQSGLYISKSEH